MAVTERQVALQRVADELVEAGCPGVVLAAEDGASSATAASGSYGGRPAGRPLRATDPLRIASVSKTVTAVVVLRLAAAGLLPLDGPVGEVLPADLVRRWSAVPGYSGLRALTPRALLGHTSGLPDYFSSPALIRAATADPERHWDPVELVDLGLASGPPLFAPGEQWSYGDTGFVLAGMAVEAVTGRPLHEVYREVVLDPLGMDDTWLEHREGPRTAEPAVALCPRPDGAEQHVGDPETRPDWAGGGLVSTAQDLARLARGLHDGSVLDAASYAAVTEWRTVDDPRYDAYGLGLGRTDVAGLALLGHTGAWGAFAYAEPVSGLVVTGSVNRFGVDRRPVLAAVVGLWSAG